MRIKLVPEPTEWRVSKEYDYLILPDFVKTIALWMFPGSPICYSRNTTMYGTMAE